MKIGGKSINGPNVITLVLPRESGEDIVIKAQAVLDMDEFDNNHPAPEAPTIVEAKTGNKRKDTSDKKYLAALTTHGEMRFNYMILKSLEATPGLEWDTVKMDDPSTWGNYQNDLKSAGFSNSERNRIAMAVFDANSLNEDRLKEARDRFIRSQAAAASEQSSLKDGLLTTESGGPANV